MAVNDPSDPRYIYRDYTNAAFINMEDQMADLDEIANQAGFEYIDEVAPMKDYFEDPEEEALYWESRRRSPIAEERDYAQRRLLNPNKGYGYNNLGDAVRPGVSPDGMNYTLPAASMFQVAFDDRIEAPTATSDPNRPRTVAAFYEPIGDEDNAGVVTLMFRDGVLYNYYDVTEEEWMKFRRATSKGGPTGPIAQYLDGKRRGPADVSELPAEYRSMYYYYARRAQYAMGGRLLGSHSSRMTKAGTPRKRPTGTIKQAREANKAINKRYKKKK